MKITANEIKTGMIIEHKNDYWNVLKTQHVKPGKGGAFNQVELKSVKKGTKLNERFRSSDTVERAILDDKKFSFLYEDENNCHFMDQVNYEQIQISKSLLGEKNKLLKEKLDFNVDLVDERLTSSEAEKYMHQMDIKVGHNKDKVDKIAASIILQEYLENYNV